MQATASRTLGRWLACLCWLALMALPAAHAADSRDIPEATGLLLDQDGALSESEQSVLAARLRAIQDTGRAQVAILVASGTGGEPLADYALRVAEKWQLGRAGKDDGLLVLVVPTARGSALLVRFPIRQA